MLDRMDFENQLREMEETDEKKLKEGKVPNSVSAFTARIVYEQSIHCAECKRGIDERFIKTNNRITKLAERPAVAGAAGGSAVTGISLIIYLILRLLKIVE